jgi:hypothetical protein
VIQALLCIQQESQHILRQAIGSLPDTFDPIRQEHTLMGPTVEKSKAVREKQEISKGAIHLPPERQNKSGSD